MEKIGVRKVFFWGSKQSFERLVWKDEDGRYFIRWYWETIEVEQLKGLGDSSWVTKEWH